MTSTSNDPSIFGWYKVIESTSNEIWTKGGNICIQDVSNNDSIQFIGFTNQGAILNGTVDRKKIIIPRQTVNISPFGGDG